jgi:hypothetical protein
MSSDAHVATRMRPHRRSSGPPIPRDGPKRVGPILVVKAHRHQKGGNRRIAVVHVARAAQQRLLPTVPVPLAAIDAALITNRVGESVDRFCQFPRERARGRWASRRPRDRRPPAVVGNPWPGVRLLVVRFMPNTWHRLGQVPRKRDCGSNGQNACSWLHARSSRPRRLLAQGTWGVATAAGCRRRPRGQPHRQGATTMRSHEILTGSSTG